MHCAANLRTNDILFLQHHHCQALCLTFLVVVAIFCFSSRCTFYHTCISHRTQVITISTRCRSCSCSCSWIFTTTKINNRKRKEIKKNIKKTINVKLKGNTWKIIWTQKRHLSTLIHFEKLVCVCVYWCVCVCACE